MKRYIFAVLPICVALLCAPAPETTTTGSDSIVFTDGKSGDAPVQIEQVGLVTVTPSVRVRTLLSNLFRDDGIPIKNAHILRIVNAAWYNGHGAAPGPKVTNDEKAQYFLDVMAKGIKQEVLNAEARLAADAAAKTAAEGVKGTDFTEIQGGE